MPLVQHPTLTPQKLEANHPNARLSRGPVTATGIERVRHAHGLHRFYSQVAGSQAADEAMRALGEKPGDFERLLDWLTGTGQPASDYERIMVGRLARALGRLGRGEDELKEAKHERSRNLADSMAHGNLSLRTRIPIASHRPAGSLLPNRRDARLFHLSVSARRRSSMPKFPFPGRGKACRKRRVNTNKAGILLITR
jgi:hypothetical protein